MIYESWSLALDMPQDATEFDLEGWLSRQMAAYVSVRERYIRLKSVMVVALRALADEVQPGALLSVRVKSMASFAEKCVRYYERRTADGQVFQPFEAVDEFNDLCGARIIVHDRTQIAAVRKRIRTAFEVGDDWNAEDELPPAQFGYRSRHMILRLPPAGKRRTVLESYIDSQVRSDHDAIAECRVELQLRTIAAHAWADLEHDLIYKGAPRIDRGALRTSARLSAMLESVDDMMEEHAQSIRTLVTNNGPYRQASDAEREMRRLRMILRHSGEHDGTSIALRLARLLAQLGRFQEVVELLEPRKASLEPEELGELGYAMCRSSSGRDGTTWTEGRRLLETAGDVESLTRLAEVSMPQEAGRYWQQAYDVDPLNPRALAGLLRQKVTEVRDRDFVELLRPNVESAIAICRQQVDLGLNLPHALFQIAQFHLMTERPYEALYSLCRAIALTSDLALLDQMISHARDLQAHCRDYVGMGWCLQTLEIGRFVRGRSADSAGASSDLSSHLTDLAGQPIAGPVVIVAGGCDDRVEERIQQYGEILRFALADFEGTVISGGTRHGISLLVGDAIEAAHGRLRGFSWIPENIPNDVVVDERYGDRRVIAGASGFSPAEPLRGWLTILASGIDPGDVRLLGINGGKIATFEYHLAAALGCPVAIARDSGGAADRLVAEAIVAGNENILFLPPDRETLRAFINFPPDTQLSNEEVARVAKEIDRVYQESFVESALKVEQERRRAYPLLSHMFDNSNCQQAIHIEEKLRRIGLKVVKRNQPIERPYQFSSSEIAALAEMEHGRWVVERTMAGWRLGPRDDARRQRPQLVGWNDPALSASEKKKDEQAVKAIPILLREIGYDIVPIEPDD